VHNYPVDDTAVVLLEFESGARGLVDCLFNVPDAASENRLELYGSNGSLLASGTIGQSAGGLVRVIAASAGDYDAAQSRPSAPGVLEWSALDGASPYLSEIYDFAEAVRTKRPPAIDGDAGLHVQRVLEACYRSAAVGKFEPV
jgi:predicted dehydrogenase